MKFALLLLYCAGRGSMTDPAIVLQDAASSPQQRQQIDDTQSARPFEGKIIKTGPHGSADTKADRYILVESSTGATYSLDNQQAAAKFAGRHVKVIASMDLKSNTLHVVDIRLVHAEK